MKIYTSAEEFSHIDDVVISVGMFDGVHLAHRQILHEVTEKAAELHAVSVILSFQPHPREVLSGKPFPLILTADEKRDLLETAGVDIWLCLPFTASIAALSAEDFWTFLNRKMKILHVVLGYNHGFGKDKQGNIHTLNSLKSKFQFGITELSCLKLGNMEISSSVIRDALKLGDIVTVNRLLGYSYFVFPHQVEAHSSDSLTVNVSPEKILPKPASYSARWNRHAIKVEITENNKIKLNFNGIAPSVVEMLKYPICFIK